MKRKISIICLYAVICHLSSVIFLYGAGNREYLRNLAKDTYRCIDYLGATPPGLPYDSTVKGENTSATNIGLYMVCVAAAVDMGFETETSAYAKISKVIDSVEKLKGWNGFTQCWHSVNDLSPSKDDPWISVLDSANLLAALMLVKQRFPKLSGRCTRLLNEVDWSKIYGVDEKMLYGGYNMATKEINKKWHIDSVGTDARLACFLAVASGDVPAEMWDSLKKETERHYGLDYYWPGMMGGGLFMQFISGIWLDERWTALGKSAADFAYAQMLYAKDIDCSVWGWSSSESPDDGYLGWGILKTNVVTPHAGVLPVIYYPDKTVENLKRLESMGAREPYIVDGKPNAFGFRDAVDIETGKVAGTYLLLDQAMIFLTLANYLEDGLVWRLLEKDTDIKKAKKLISFYRDEKKQQYGKLYAERNSSEVKAPTPQAAASSVKTEPMIVDNFNKKTFVNLLGGKWETWTYNDKDVLSGCRLGYDGKNKNGKDGYSLKIEYDVDSSNSAWNGCLTKLKSADISGYNAISFYIKGDETTGFPKLLKCEIWGKGGTGVYYLKDITSSWQKKIIPLTLFGGMITEWTDMEKFLFCFEDSKAGDKDGIIYIDDIVFEKVPPEELKKLKTKKIAAAGPLDSCDSPAGWTTDGWKGTSYKVSASPGKKDKSLMLDYDLADTNQWVQMDKDFDISLTENYNFSFYFKGEGSLNNLEFKLVDADGSVFGKKFNKITSDKNWQRLTVFPGDLNYMWGGDKKLGRIKKIFFAVSSATDGGGKGRIYIDELEFNNISGWTSPGMGYFNLAKVNGRDIFIDPAGNPFYSKAMVYAYGPEEGPHSGNLTAQKTIKALELMKQHGFNTIDLYGERFLDEILEWCDKNKMAVYFRRQHTDQAEFPDYMDGNLREKVKHGYDEFLNKIKKHRCVLAVDMDQRWLYVVDWSGKKRPAAPVLGPESVNYFPKWLKSKYGGIEKLNSEWGKSYKSFEDVLDDSGIIKSGKFEDTATKPWRADIFEYTFWTINDFLKELSEYMKKIDPNHLLTYTTEMPEAFPFPISTKENSGMDFISPVHYNSAEDYGRDWIANGEMLYMTKWHNDLYGMPVFINETGFRTSPLGQNPPNLAYAMAKEGDEEHAAGMYVQQTSLMNLYPWMLGWGYFKLYDKPPEGDFGYIRNDGGLKPVSRLGLEVNDKLPVNMQKEKEPQVWIYYPEYALCSPYASYQQYKSLVLMLEDEFLSVHKKMVDDFLKNKKNETLFMESVKVFNAQWLPFAFTSVIPSGDKPIILAGRALEVLTHGDREKLAGKKTVTIGQVGIYGERYRDTQDWYSDVIGILPEESKAKIIKVPLSALFNNDGLGAGDFDARGNTFLSDGLPDNSKIFSYEGIDFIFPNHGKNNNIACKGQRIGVPEESAYSWAHFLAASHSGDICVRVRADYSDGSREYKYLGPTVPGWRAESGFGRSVVSVKSSDGSSAYINYISVPLNGTKKLDSITLPDENRVHIFAVSLSKGGAVADTAVSVSMDDVIVAGTTPWAVLLSRTGEKGYKTLAKFGNGLPAVVQSGDGLHTAFLYDPLTWAGKKDEISRKVTEHSKILKKVLFE